MKTTRRSLLIGVNAYMPAFGPLRFCASDAKRLENALNSRRAGFTGTEAKLLTDDQPDERQPTKSHIIENIVHLCKTATHEDTLLIHFSGHGAIDEDGHLYLLPLDASPVSLEQTAVSWQWVKDNVEQSRARNKIILIDACHSGAGRDATASIRVSSKIIGELERSKSGIICLTSCSGGQRSYELQELEQGLFSHYLVKGIAGAADPLGRGIIDVESLYAFVRDRTSSHAQQCGFEQTPYLISKVSAPLNTFIISATDIERPINRVLILTDDPLLGRFLECVGLPSLSTSSGSRARACV